MELMHRFVVLSAVVTATAVGWIAWMITRPIQWEIKP